MRARQAARAVWLTGLSGAGKSTIAARLHAALPTSVLLDGDVIRCGLNSDLSFSDADRSENIRRVSEVARLIVASGSVAIVALISPFRVDRDLARAKFAHGQFVEVFVDTPLAVAETRDEKGLYRRARAGLLPQFTGIDSAYEPPLRPEIHLRTDADSADVCTRQILAYLHTLQQA